MSFPYCKFLPQKRQYSNTSLQVDINKCEITTEFLQNSTLQLLSHSKFFMINVIVMNIKEINNHLLINFMLFLFSFVTRMRG